MSSGTVGGPMDDPCPYCKAEVGKPCVNAIGPKAGIFTSFSHYVRLYPEPMDFSCLTILAPMHAYQIPPEDAEYLAIRKGTEVRPDTHMRLPSGRVITGGEMNLYC